MRSKQHFKSLQEVCYFNMRQKTIHFHSEYTKSTYDIVIFYTYITINFKFAQIL